MSAFLKLEQLVDRRKSLVTHKSYRIPKRKTPVARLERGIHHSATRVHLAGSNPEGFANYHVNHLNWPCIGYTFTITPSRIINTSNGPRAEISFNRNLDDLTYHVGNSNDFSLGICIAGDYRYDKLSTAAILSFTELNQALDQDGIAMGIMRGHNKYPGYNTTACPVYDPQQALAEGTKLLGKIDDIIYEVKSGDTLYGISRMYHGITAQELMEMNKIKDPRLLQIGTELKIHQTEKTYKIEEGHFKNTSGSRIYVRYDTPSIYSPVATMLDVNDTVSYDRIYYRNGYLWISQMNNNRRRFIPITTYNKGKVGQLWGEFY